MFIKYGSIDLRILRILQWDRRAVYDAAMKGYRHDTILRVRGFYNPGAMAYAFLGKYGNMTPTPVLNPLPDANASWGGQTEEALRSYMMTPRRKLIVTVPDTETPAGANERGREVLVAPARDPKNPNQFFKTDCLNGPRPLDFRIVKWGGSKTCEIEWACLVSLAFDCQYFEQDPPLVISHVYRMETQLNQQFFATRTITGEAVFRTDKMLELGFVPDEFRASLFHPVPAFMQRVDVRVSAAEDGSKLSYRTVDQELGFNLNPGLRDAGVTRVQAFFTQGWTTGGVEGAATQYANGFTGGGPGGGAGAGVQGFISGMSISGGGAPVSGGGASAGVQGGVVGALVGLAQNFENRLMQMASSPISAIPRLRKQLHVKAWGDRLCKRSMLHVACWRVLRSLIDPASVFLNSGQTFATEDLTGPYVELVAVVDRGPAGSAWKIAQTLLAGGEFLPSGLDEIPQVTTRNDVRNPAPFYDNKGRGTFLGLLAHQVLADPCNFLEVPENPRNVGKGRIVNRQPEGPVAVAGPERRGAGPGKIMTPSGWFPRTRR